MASVLAAPAIQAAAFIAAGAALAARLQRRRSALRSSQTSSEPQEGSTSPRAEHRTGGAATASLFLDANMPRDAEGRTFHLNVKPGDGAL
jgi:hypothetical protein